MNADKLEKLALHISSLKSKVKCPICLEPAERGIQLECQHRFCSNCISQITQKKPSSCPICKSPIKKRALLYKDHVADSLGTFINSACQIIKEKYAQDVESLSSGKLNLQKVIEVAPPDFINPNLITKKGSTTLTNQTGRTDNNSKKLRVLIPFNNETTKHRIVDWLNKNNNKFDKMSPSPLGEETTNFQMPSISQVALAEKKSKGVRQRSQSLTVYDNLPEPLVKRYRSLTEGLNNEEIDDYSIEEVYSETVIKQVERKVIQNLLEDECLAQIDQVAKEAVKADKWTPPKKRKRSSKKNKSPNDLGSSSGWNRLKKVKNSLEIIAKTPKQLKIKLQSPDTKRKSDSKNEEDIEPLKRTEAIETVNVDHLNSFANPVWVEPIQNNSKDLNSVAVQLLDKLKMCQSNAGTLPKEHSHQLQECFTNLLTYVNQIVQLSKDKHFSKCFESVATQTDILEQFDVGIQTENKTEPMKDKYIQTLNSQYRNVLVQTDDLEKNFSALKGAKEGKMTSQSKREENVVSLDKTSKKVADPDGSGQIGDKRKSSSRILSSSKSSQTSKSSQPAHISVDESKDNKSSKTNISEVSELLITLGSSSKSTNKKINRKLVYEEPKSDRKFKRIKTFSSDSEPEDGLPKKRKLVRDDFTVEFLDSENVLSPTTPDSDKIDYDQYLLDVMSKYDPGPSTTTKKPSPVKKSKKLEAVLKKNTQISNSLNDDHVFTNCTALENFDLEIMEQQPPKSLNTELDLVEPTPVEPTKPPKFKLSSKKVSLESNKPEKIISKGAAPSLRYPELVETNNFDKTGTLNRNLPLQTQTDTDLADMLKDLENRKDIFQDDFESQAIKISKNVTNKGPCEFEDDQELENQLEKISFPASEQLLNQDKVNILQDVVIRNDDLELVESDGSDCDIVDSTPQKVKPNFADRSILRDLDGEQNITSQDLDLCLPPPPGFADVELDATSVDNHKENHPPAAASLQRLTDFLVSPDNKLTQSERLVTQTNTPKTRQKHTETHRTSEIIIEDTEEVFSPIAKSSVRPSQCKFTPLLSVSRSAKKATILTSTPTQKSILNFVVPSQHSTTSKKPCIMWSRIINKDLNVFTQLECKKLLATVKIFNDQVTHLVVLVDERGRIVSHTAKTLQAIAAGIWVVRYEWVEDCLRMNRIVAEEPYEVLDSTGQPGPQTSRLTRKSSPLFKGFRFLCAPPLKSVSKSDLENIIRLSGGDVTNDISDFLLRDGKTNLIITESEFTEDIEHFEGYLDNFKTVTVDVEWLSSCIGQYKIVSFRPYLVTGDESAIGELGYPPVLIESVPFTLTETNI